jgi:hypothetical protein
MTQEERQ